MSTTWMLREPTLVSVIEEATGWKLTKTPDGEALTDGTNYVWPWWDDAKERVIGFERFGRNDASDIAESLNAVSEHDENDPDYDRLFNIEE